MIPANNWLSWMQEGDRRGVELWDWNRLLTEIDTHRSNHIDNRDDDQPILT